MSELLTCPHCGSASERHGFEVKIAGDTFIQDGHRCTACDERWVTSTACHAVELDAARSFLRDAPNGAKFRWVRRCMGLRQDALADRLGVRVETVSRYENDKRKVSRTVWRLMRALFDAEVRQ